MLHTVRKGVARKRAGPEFAPSGARRWDPCSRSAVEHETSSLADYRLLVSWPAVWARSACWFSATVCCSDTTRPAAANLLARSDRFKEAIVRCGFPSSNRSRSIAWPATNALSRAVTGTGISWPSRVIRISPCSIRSIALLLAAANCLRRSALNFASSSRSIDATTSPHSGRYLQRTRVDSLSPILRLDSASDPQSM